MKALTGKRIGVFFLLLVLGVLVFLVVANSLADGRLYLQLKHGLQSSQRYEAVATLHIEAVGEIKMFLNPDDEGLTPAIVNHGIWEPNETYWFTRSVKAGNTVLDIGANVGYYTLLGAALVGEEGVVYAFEPDPVSFRLLEQNVRLNGLQNVVLEQKAVSNEPGSIRLYLAEENKGDHRIFETEGRRESIEVEAVSLDEYFRGHEGSIDFVKIDTQGAEAVIIQGMSELIRDNDGMLMAVEFWPYGLSEFGFDAAELLEVLRSFGFHFFDLGIWQGRGGKFVFSRAKRLQLEEKEIALLLEQYTVENEMFTNLLLTRDPTPPAN